MLVIYNYFRERWLVDRLANTAAAAFGEEPYVHVHEARAYLGVLMAGPRLHTLTAPLVVPDQVLAYGQSHAPSPSKPLTRDPSIEPATDDWPFLYMRDRHLPGHYAAVIAMILAFSAIAVFATLWALPAGSGGRGAWSWQFFLLGAGFMLLETKAIIQFALLWGSTWVVASLAIASVLGMALAANFVVARREITPPGARRRRAGRAAGAELRDPDRPNHLREPRAGVALLRASSSSARSCAPGCCSGRRSSARPRSRATTAPTCSARWSAASPSTRRW